MNEYETKNEEFHIVSQIDTIEEANTNDILEEDENDADIDNNSELIISDDDDTNELFISDDSCDDNDDNIEPQITNIDDAIIDIGGYQEKQKSIIKNVSNILNLTEDVTFLLLKKFDFNSNLLFEHWTKQNDSKQNLPRMINIPAKMIDKSLIIQQIGIGTCPICCNENCQLYQFHCGHSLCLECIQNEIEIQINERHFPVSCRIDSCNTEIMVHEIEKFIGIEKAKKYVINYIENQIQISNKYAKCTFPNCPYFLNRKFFSCCNTGQCKCGNRFCLECYESDHSPISCDQVHEWKLISHKMNHLFADQKEWEKKEASLWNYRRRHTFEIRRAIDAHLDEVNKEYEKLSQKENEEIASLTKLIKSEDDENEKKMLVNKLNEKILAHNFNKSRKENEEKVMRFFASQYIMALNNNEGWFFDSNMTHIINDDRYYTKKEIKRCPKCHIFVYKDGGCNHMTCKICYHQFCWICLKEWPKHDENCRSNRLSNRHIFNRNDNQNDNQNENQNENRNENQNENQNDNQNDNQNENQNENRNENQNENQNDNQNDNQNANQIFKQNANQSNLIEKQEGPKNIEDIKKIFVLRKLNQKNIKTILYNNEPNSQYNQNSIILNRPNLIFTDYNGNDSSSNTQAFQRYACFMNDDEDGFDDKHEFTIPPINAKTHFDFERWALYHHNNEFHNNLIQRLTQFANKPLDNIYIRLQSVLAHSYQLLYFLDPSSVVEYNMFEIQVENLEKIYSSLQKNDKSIEISSVDRSIQALLKSADEINFLNLHKNS